MGSGEPDQRHSARSEEPVVTTDKGRLAEVWSEMSSGLAPLLEPGKQHAAAIVDHALTNKHWCPCGHSAQWHHETRGCGYHGFGAHRCDCTHSADGVVEWLVFHAVSNVLDDMRDALLQGGQSHQIRWKAAVEVLERYAREVAS